MADDENKPTHAEAKEEEEKADVSSAEDSMEKSDTEETSKMEEETKKEETKEEETKEENDNKSDKDVENDKEVEELPPGLLEQPLEVHGKREKRKVERLSASMVPSSNEKKKKKVEIVQGSGVKLSDVPFIENQLNTTLAMDLKPLHRILFLRVGTQMETKRNIKQFCGFTHAKSGKEYERRMTLLNKLFLPELKTMCLVLGLEKKGTKAEMVEKIMDFLIKPEDKGLPVPEKVKRQPKSATKPKGEKRKKTPKSAAKKSKSKAKPKAKNDDDEDDDAGSLDNDDEEEEEGKGNDDEEELESEDEAPKKKKAKVEPKKKSPKVSKQNGKKEKLPKKQTKKAAPKKIVLDELEDSLSDDSDSEKEQEQVSTIKEKMPPSNETIKELVKTILDGADLETVTMKTVVKQVYSEYPSFDLSDRKDFIKDSVRDIIS